jgi:hypothetical protein
MKPQGAADLSESESKRSYSFGRWPIFRGVQYLLVGSIQSLACERRCPLLTQFNRTQENAVGTFVSINVFMSLNHEPPVEETLNGVGECCMCNGRWMPMPLHFGGPLLPGQPHA